MRRRTIALVTAVALASSGCGLLAGPTSVTSEAEVVDALLALGAGARMRATADLTVDADEVRDVLRGDEAARELLAERDVDGDEVLARLEEAAARLADHAVLLSSGADHSVRLAAEYRGQVWLDLRGRTDLLRAASAEQGGEVDLQAQVDWEVAAEVLDQPSLRDALDDLLDEFGTGLDTPAVTNVLAVLQGLAEGELVAISGTIDPELRGLLRPGASPPVATPRPELDPREALAAGIAVDGFRRDGATTVVDLHVQPRAMVAHALDELAAAPDAFDTTFEQVEAWRADLDEVPERIDDVATLRFDATGTLTGVRVDVLGTAARVASVAAPEDEDAATVARVLGALDRTGLFVTAEVTDVGDVDTVLGTPTATASPEDVVGLLGVLFLGLPGGLGEGVLPLDVLEQLDLEPAD